MTYLIPLGKVRHLSIAPGETACGITGGMDTNNTSKVDCLRCRKTKIYKYLKRESMRKP